MFRKIIFIITILNTLLLFMRGTVIMVSISGTILAATTITGVILLILGITSLIPYPRQSQDLFYSYFVIIWNLIILILIFSIIFVSVESSVL